MYVIKFKFGNNVSGVLPEEYEDEEDAKFHCDQENKQYNNINHYVLNLDDKTCADCCYHINDTVCEDCTDFSKFVVC